METGYYNSKQQSKPRDSLLTIVNDEEKQQICTFKKLEQAKFYIFA